MPQMAPMPWVFLMMLTILSLMLVSSMIYFTNQAPPFLNKTKSQMKLKLKW